MKLELAVKQIRDVRLAGETAVRGDTLFIDADELKSILLQDKRIGSVDIDIAKPGEDCRVANIFDIVEPRTRSAGSDFPGVLGPMATVGVGRTHVLRGVAVVEVNGLEDRYNKIIDMSGLGATLGPFSQTCNVALMSTPASGVDRPTYYNALKIAGLRASVYLAESAKHTAPDEVEVYELQDPDTPSENAANLPKVAYNYMLYSHQRPTEQDEPIFYGDNVKGLLPTVVHPNEILDGAVLCGYWNLGLETYTIQNHPVIKELYARHNRDLRFAGVIVNVAYPTQAERERSIAMAVKLAKYTLGVDGLVLTKVGGGIPETDLMLTCERCEELGIQTAVIVWSMIADGTVDGSLSFCSPKANAIASVGIFDATVKLPQVARVIGAETIGPFVDGSFDPSPATSAVEVRIRDIAGGLSQIGGSHIRMLEY